MRNLLTLLFIFSFLFLPSIAWSGSSTPTNAIVVTEQASFQLYYFWDLRDRDSYLQVMNTDGSSAVLHIQTFIVNNNCNEVDFYDFYTANDTHIYNMRDLITNGGAPAGVVLPDNSYGFTVITVRDGIGGQTLIEPLLIGSFRIIDDNGFEYRTNAAGFPGRLGGTTAAYTFNFDNFNGAGLSDVVGMTFNDIASGSTAVQASNITEIFTKIDMDIYNDNEIPFSCRDVAFACTDENNPLYDDLLEDAEVSAGGFEFGVNDSVLHSKGAELLCPANAITKGFVRMETENVSGENQADMFVGFVGLNDGANRGSLEVFTASP